MKNKELYHDSDNRNITIVGFVLAFLLPPVGFMISFIANNRIKRTKSKDWLGMSVAGIVISVVGMSLEVLFFFGILLSIALGVS